MKIFDKKNLKLIVRIGISSVLIILLIWKQDFTLIVDKVVTYNPLFLISAFVALALGTLFSCFRWKEILNALNYNVDLKTLYTLYIKGYFYNNFLPTQMGGDLYKSISLGTLINNQAHALFSVFMDRFSGLLVLLSLSLLGISSIYGTRGIVIGSCMFIFGIILYSPILKTLSTKIKFFGKFKDASDSLIKKPKSAGKIIFYSLTVQAFSFLMSYILFLGFGVKIPLWTVIAYMPLTSLSLIIPSFNGFGTQELVLAGLFLTTGVTPEISIAVSVLIHSIRLVMSMAGGILIISTKPNSQNSNLQTTQ